jgi:hypothetical protein
MADIDLQSTTASGFLESDFDQIKAAYPAHILAVITHGTVAGTARPSGYKSVMWIGSEEPTNSTNNDVWIDTTEE